MMLELISEITGRSYKLSARAFGKVLYLARQQGWQPGRVHNEWPSDNWETQIFLPYLGPYMPGRISRAEADALRIALTRALATGAVAAEGTANLASSTLLQVAREGAFRVLLINSDAEEFGMNIRRSVEAH